MAQICGQPFAFTTRHVRSCSILQDGVVINLTLEDGKLRFEIDSGAAEHARPRVTQRDR
jgi:hypothetical protein